MPSRMLVRSVRGTDFEGLYALRSHRYAEIAVDPDHGLVSNATRPPRGEFAARFGELHRAVLDGSGVGSVAKENGQISGTCGVEVKGTSVKTRHIGVLGLEGLRGLRGRGVGTALRSHAMGARRGRFEIVDLAGVPVNETAKRLHQNLGFATCGTLPLGFQRGGRYHDFTLMYKRIESGPAAQSWSRPPLADRRRVRIPPVRIP